MEPLSRRATLRYAGYGVAVPFGGRFDVAERFDSGGRAGESSAEVRQFAAAQTEPDWYEEGASGHVELFGAADRALERLPFDRAREDRRERLRAFVEDTDFERARLLYVASAGPDACYAAVEVRELAVEETITGTVAALDTSDEDELCAQALTFPSALVRVTADGDPPDRAELIVIDGWGNAESVEATTDALIEIPCDRDGHVRPAEDPETVPGELGCSDEPFERHAPGFDGEPPWGVARDDGTPTFALRVDDLAVERGETVTVTLTNVAEERLSSGSEDGYNLQVYTEAGWQDVRGWIDGDPRPYADERVAHEPGEGFEWTVRMAGDDVVAGHVHEDALTVCPGLPSGRYRFVFWDPTVAVAFDLGD